MTLPLRQGLHLGPNRQRLVGLLVLQRQKLGKLLPHGVHFGIQLRFGLSLLQPTKEEQTIDLRGHKDLDRPGSNTGAANFLSKRKCFLSGIRS